MDSQSTTREWGHSGSDKAKTDKENLSSSVPSCAIEVSILVFLFDFGEEVPARGAIGNVVSGRTASVLARVELTDDISFPILHMPKKRTRVSLGGEGFDTLVSSVVDGELPGFNANFVESEGFEAGVAPDSEVGGVSIFTDHETAFSFIVELRRDGELLPRSATRNPKHPSPRIPERGRTTSPVGIEHTREL